MGRRSLLWVPGALGAGALSFGVAVPLWLLGLASGLWPLLITGVVSAAVTWRFTRATRDGARAAQFALLSALGSGLAYAAGPLFDAEPEFGRWYTATVCFVILAVPLAIVNLGAAVVSHGVARRGRAGGCRSCGYDHSGLPPGSPCPECAGVRTS
jgi:CDP-diglyceride synthetase